MVSDLLTNLSKEQLASLGAAVEGSVKGAARWERTTYGLSHDRSWTIDVLRADCAPYRDTHVAVSIGLSNCSWVKWNFPDRIEVVHVWDGQSHENEKLAITAAETMILTGPAKPGAIYLDAVKAAGLAVSERMPHALITFPYLSNWKLDKIVADRTNIWILQVTPIFEQEMRFIQRNGFAKFEELLSYDVMDLYRMGRASHVR
jgi:hypothetical protein